MSETVSMSDFYYACQGMSYVTYNVEHCLKAGASVNGPISENDEIDHRGFTPLHVAAMHNNVRAADVLLHYGADVNLKNESGQTPLHVAYRHKAFGVIDTILEYQSTCVGISLVNSVDNEGLSHFHIACRGRCPNIIEAYIQNNVDINTAVNMDSKYWAGYTALHFAVFDRGLDSSVTDMANLLLKHGAAVNARDARGCTPLHIAAQLHVSKSLIETLLKNGADVNAETIIKETAIIMAAKEHNWDFVESLIKYGANVAVRDKFEYTLLHMVCEGNNACIAKKLLKNNADVNAVALDGKTALHATVQTREHTLVSINSTAQNEIIRELMLRGCDVNARDIKGHTALHYACQKENGTGVLSLLKRGADIDVKDNAGNTPRDYFNEAGQGYSQVKHVLFYFTEMLRICGARETERYKDYKNIYLGDNIYKQFLESIKYDCMNELKSMKSIFIYSSTTLDHILVRSRNKMAHYMNNPKIQKIGKSIAIEKLFPIYGPLIKRHINEGYSRQSCLLPASDAFRALIPYHLPDLCLNLILDYLEDDDLRNITNAVKLIDLLGIEQNN